MAGNRLPSRCGSFDRTGFPEADFFPETTQLFDAIMRGMAVPQKPDETIRLPSVTRLINSTSSSPRMPGNNSCNFSSAIPACTNSMNNLSISPCDAASVTH